MAGARRFLPLRSDACRGAIHGQGDAILYDVTVEDPEVLVEPWVLPTRTIRRNTNPDAGLLRERGNCEIYEDGAAVTQIRH